MSYRPTMKSRRRFFRTRTLSTVGKPKYEVGDKIGHFEIIRYEGHS
jgi:hypothetical protein